MWDDFVAGGAASRGQYLLTAPHQFDILKSGLGYWGAWMQFDRLKRREFITLLASAAAAWPLGARAQQAAMPVIGYLNNGSPESDASRLTGLRRGLHQTGYVEGRSLVIE